MNIYYILKRLMRKLKILLVLICVCATSNVYAIEQKEIKEAYYQSYELERLGNYPSAVHSLGGVIEEYPEGYTINLRLGWLHYLNKNYFLSEKHYLKAIETSPFAINAKLGLANVFSIQGKINEARGVLHKIRSVDKHNYQANLHLAKLYHQEEKYMLAEQIIYEMLKFYPTDINLLTLLASIKNTKKDKKKARALFLDIQILAPHNPLANRYLKTNEEKKPNSQEKKKSTKKSTTKKPKKKLGKKQSLKEVKKQ